MYGSGRGVKMDRAESVKWHRRAAAQGDAGSFDSLGFMYWRGGGVVLDKIKAYACFGIAADLMAQHDRPGMTDDSRKAKGQYAKTKKFAMDLLAKEMSGAELSEARQLIRECAKKDFLDCGM
jgi:TPR repeat protein